MCPLSEGVVAPCTLCLVGFIAAYGTCTFTCSSVNCFVGGSLLTS